MRRRAVFGVVMFLAGAVVSAAVSTGVVLAAGPMFNDVPVDHPFSEEIEELAGDCVTGGYADGGFHPADPVTRQAMAAFLTRGRDPHAVGTTTGAANPYLGGAAGSSGTGVTVATVEVTIPDLPGTCWFDVDLEGQVFVASDHTRVQTCDLMSGDFCHISALLLQQGAGPVDSAVVRVDGDHMGQAMAVAGTAVQQDGTTATYELFVSGFNLRTDRVWVGSERQLTATTHRR